MRTEPGQRGERLSRRVRWIEACLLVLLGVLVVLGAGTAAAQPRSDFDHLRTGFALDGAHARLECESCHKGGVFEGTPNTCTECHDGSSLRAQTAKTGQHIPTELACSTCHTTEAWSVARFNHADATQPCQSCHNGVSAVGKGPTHPSTSKDCQTCHTTTSWSDVRFDHTGITGNCVSCHNGTTATGKSPGHISSGNNCQDCHTTTTWTGAVFDHVGVTSACSTCHNGVTATGKQPGHIPSGNNCEDCHTTVTWTGAVFDHTGITTGCASCHNGATAAGKPPNHIPTSQGCEACHSTIAWLPAGFDHTGVIGGCASCHNDIQATGKPGNHFITQIGCENCHRTVAWVPDVFQHTSPNYPGDHRRALGCTDCHIGNSQSPAFTIATYAPDCAGCHANDFVPNKHEAAGGGNETVSQNRNCAGACHQKSSHHRVTDSSWDR